MSAAFALPPDDATIAAYLSNQLPNHQAEAFELYCLDHPEFSRRVELDLCIKHGLRRIGIRNVIARPVFRFPQRWSMAASLGAVLVCGLLVLLWSQRHIGLTAYRNLSEVPLQMRSGSHFDVTLLRLRGSDATHKVVAPGHSGLLTLKIFPDSAQGIQGYSADIVLASKLGSRSVVLNRLRADASGFLSLYLSLSDVVGHTLDITLTSDNGSSAPSAPAFRLQVVAATD
ncbi:MAG TPA: hypothetical protein VGV09_00815 [Steroidobacteraceae bacterium]|nr:hypothetical protein [Steroidobacteraceae bacterium]